MSITPRDLKILLDKRPIFSSFNVWFFLACVALSAYSLKATSFVSWVVAIGLVAPAFWFIFTGPAFLNNWASNHRFFFASWLAWALKLAFIYIVIKVVAPIAISLIQGWVYA